MSTTKKNPAAAAAGTEEKKRTVRKPAAAARKAGSASEQKIACVKVLLNLREGPGYDFGIIRVLNPNEKLLLKGRPKNGFIAAVLPDGSEGWVCAEFVEVINGV